MQTGFLFIALFSVFCFAYSGPPSDLSLTVTRNVDATTQLAKYILTIKAKNNGNDVSYFIHPISKEESQHLSYITAYEGKNKKLQVSQLDKPLEDPGYVYYKIDFSSPLKKGSTFDFKIEYVLTESLKLYPAEISQADSQ